ncbi:hypothetical protein, partial [uncultured Caballeronia sp.]|uniref:hypothetical protein n=1 Tax=uncultured Caballeronia sp. TaxID=1827198 RepID=UPI0035CB2DCF
LKYLNTLEAVLVGWHHGVAHPAIIEQEFKTMLEGGTIMANFRYANSRGKVGKVSSYPAIAHFYDDVIRPTASQGEAPITRVGKGFPGATAKALIA